MIIDLPPLFPEPKPKWTDECCTYRVPQRLRQVKEEAYTPKLISIGPFHHDKEELRDMEALKLRYYIELCRRTGTEPRDIASIIEKKEQKTINCYDGSLDMRNENILQIILVDSIFIIEYFARDTAGGQWSKTVRNPWLKAHIMLDLILLENQIPFFILHKLYKKFFKRNCEDSFFKLACEYFWKNIYFPRRSKNYLRRK